MYFIYALQDSQSIRYVGITNDIERRFNEHKNDITNLSKWQWMNTEEVSIVVLQEVDELEQGLLFEELFIRRMKHLNLFNQQKVFTEEEKYQQAMVDAKKRIKELKKKK